MNLYWRLLLTFVQFFMHRPTADPLTPARIRLRVYPNDLDSNGHMNNGRYLKLMDLGRLHLILRVGLLRVVLRRGLAPTLAAVQVRYRMQLLPFQPFDLETRILCWDEKWVYMEQRFIFVRGPKAGEVAAIALVKGGFYDRTTKTTMPTAEILSLMRYAGPTPPIPAYVADWIRAEDSLRRVTQ
jgi:acyl-CoA thioesterase FadM